ncbi:hypothetical protein FJU30_20995 [Affinibrenneria salicis]|uniref:Uncharacterized protein n=1 Tax=Affinibrenneria salicis TaxID=2590031 RepID=A0A5J5FU30_9GAMM|nr:hypothetical protein [Affinibrenneria salicis]KAA8996683.1 hypothetical protein FJU30_20995 [Affinibrenneria salicis]
MEQTCRLIIPFGYAMLFSDWRQLSILTDVLQIGGFIWRGLAPWDKTAASRAPHTGYSRHQCEYMDWGRVGTLPKCQQDAPWPGMLSQRVIPTEKLHMTGKPVEPIRPVSPDGHILDRLWTAPQPPLPFCMPAIVSPVLR